jgi:predicted alpha/beta hydrolase family esterase
MGKSVYIVPDAAASVKEESNWYHLYKNRLRRLNEARVGKSPDEIAPTAAAWAEDQAEAINELHAGKDGVLVGHGYGAVAVLRFLERQQQEQQVGRVILVSTPIGVPPIRDAEATEAFSGGYNFDWDTIRKNTGHVSIFHAFNDPEVSVANAAALAGQFGTVAFVPGGGGHFNTEEGIATLTTFLPIFSKG